jgi:hypothetical protein
MRMLLTYRSVALGEVRGEIKRWISWMVSEGVSPSPAESLNYGA